MMSLSAACEGSMNLEQRGVPHEANTAGDPGVGLVPVGGPDGARSGTPAAAGVRAEPPGARDVRARAAPRRRHLGGPGSDSPGTEPDPGHTGTGPGNR